MRKFMCLAVLLLCPFAGATCFSLLQPNPALLSAPTYSPDDTFIVIVDPASTGKHAAEPFRRRGYRVISIKSAPVLASFFENSLDRGKFDHALVYQQNLPALLAELRVKVGRHKLIVFPGADTGVQLSELLNASLNLPTGNVAGLQAARHDKFETVAAVALAGLPAPQQVRTANLDEALKFLERLGSVFVKPPNSSGGNLAFHVSDPGSMANALDQIVGKINADGKFMSHAVLQELLLGEEYAVNGVASDGHFLITDILRYKKVLIPGHGSTYIEDVLVPFDAAEVQSLIPYALQVLKAVGFRYGPFHLEVKGGSVVELNARTCGGDLPVWTSRATQVDYLDLIAEAYLDPKAFRARPQGYLVHHHFTAYTFRVPEAGLFLDPAIDAIIRAIPGVLDLEWYPRDLKEVLPVTYDLDSSLGRAMVMNPNLQVVETATRKLELIQSQRQLFKR